MPIAKLQVKVYLICVLCCAMDWEFIRRPLTAETRTQFQVTCVRFVLLQLVLGQVFSLPVHQSSHVTIIPPVLHTDLILDQRRCMMSVI